MSLRTPPAPRRRALLLSAAAAVAAPWGLAQPTRLAARPITVAQVVDTSPSQQDVAKDLLVGSRAAWQDINLRGGVRGRPVNHLAVEVDGTAAGVRKALDALRDDPGCLLLAGTAGDPLATILVEQLRADGMGLAHVAPWLQNSSLEVDDRTFPIFAARQEQIGHALRSLATMGVQDVGAVYASDLEQRLYRDDLDRTAAALKLKIQAFRGDGDLHRLAQRLTPGTPTILLFFGGTPELVQFTQGLDRQQRQRYLVAMADVNLQTLQQMGGARATPVIVTQPVPLVTSGTPIVRAYRETLARLFDEPPAALSLAGFIAARYTYEVLADIDAPLTRPSVLAAFQRRTARDLGGFRVAFDDRRRSGAFVTQSMLTPDGRVVG
ncbi:MAG TPA: ABC transporter substrate-binding protein [Ramlibacter sp.]|jgi:ABC-type branched-subunit amino acid transport system substrate-binding protein|uniref:ABC transporter substrate-binding protein n=1 Tax=Ramlibacter sp. TaxID=1917967 RepID=UPI002D378A11|nr:ABC transporter substrate-binding protein [Ramlibacter sp.]HZY18222.1 ABC transporter substrate-binding protein [Ramlibacter sp.]